MDTLALLSGLRFIDSLFPSGGYAFSSGLEAAVHEGAVTDASSLQRYMGDLLEHGMAGREAVAVALAHDATMTNDLESVLRVDQDLDEMKLDRATRLASRQMGRQVIRVAAEADATKLLQAYLTAVETDASPGHFAVCLGSTLADVGWPKKAAVGAFLYHSAAGLVSAGMKLLPVGQREAQRILKGWIPWMDRLSGMAATQRDMVTFAPLQDIYAMRHSRLASRLFRS